MNHRQLKYALAVRDERNFSRAASRLRVSQPSVSEQVKLLEEELGFALFRRTGRGVELTRDGRSFLREAEQAMGQFASLSDFARQLSRGNATRFALGLSSGIARYFTPPIMAGLKQLLTEVQLEVITAVAPRVQRLVLDRELDAGMIVEINPSRLAPGIEREFLTRIEMSVFVPLDHRLAVINKPVELDDLIAEPLIMNEPSVGYGALVQSMFQDQGLAPGIVAVADSVNTIKTMIRSGVGIAVLPAVCAELELRLGELVRLSLRPRREVSVVLLRPAMRLPPNAEECIAAVIRTIRAIEETPFVSR